MKKNILITGATSGLGLDLYKNLKKDEKINLICFYKDKNKINKIKNKSNFIKVDFFNKNDVSNLSNLNILKNIDTVIHCAGGGLGYRSDNINLEQFDKLMTLNFYSVFEINKILIKKKLKKKRLNIIMIGSLAELIPIIKFLIEKKSDVLTGSVISATNLEG